MPRGQVARQHGGRRRILSTINVEAARLYEPCARLGPLAYVTGHKPRGSSGTPPRPGPYSAGPGAYLRDPACPLGSPGPFIQGSGVPQRSGAIDAPRDVLSFLATWCP